MFGNLNPLGSYHNPTMDQVTNETLGVAAGMPEPIARSLMFGLGISQWASRAENMDPMETPQFINAYNSLVSPQSSLGGGSNDLSSLLGAILNSLS